MQVLDFGLMDFISGHHGAIPASAMRSPGQFEHELLRQAKATVVAAALAHGVIPAHNVTLDLKTNTKLIAMQAVRVTDSDFYVCGLFTQLKSKRSLTR